MFKKQIYFQTSEPFHLTFMATSVFFFLAFLVIISKG